MKAKIDRVLIKNIKNQMAALTNNNIFSFTGKIEILYRKGMINKEAYKELISHSKKIGKNLKRSINCEMMGIKRNYIKDLIENKKADGYAGGEKIQTKKAGS